MKPTKKLFKGQGEEGERLRKRNRSGGFDQSTLHAWI
jgi:hypothetical protein